MRASNARASRADEFAKRSYIWSVGTDATGIHGQAEIFRLLDAKAGVVELSEAVTFRGNQAVAPRQIHRARRPARIPRLSYDVEEVVPISPIPHNSSGCSGYTFDASRSLP